MVPRWLRPLVAWSVVDGDTISVTLDLGFSVFHKTKLRLLGIDTPELSIVRQRAAAAVCSAAVKAWLSGKEPRGLTAETFQEDKYAGRWDADVFVGPEGLLVRDRLVAWLLKGGYGRPYVGGKKTEWTDEELLAIVGRGVPVIGAGGL